MRGQGLGFVLVFAFLAGCGDNIVAAPEAAPMSMRERLAGDARLLIEADRSAGVVTAQRWSSSGWVKRLVDLRVTGGELTVKHAAGGALEIGALEIGFATVAIPSTVTGHDAALADLQLRLAAPVAVAAAWADDDEARVSASVALALSWSLEVEGTSLPIGAPALPPLPVTIELTGDGFGVAAVVRVRAAGELWSWADLVKLTDLALVLDARTPRDAAR